VRPSQKNREKWLWITDPWDTLDIPNDTSLRLLYAGFELGVEQSWCDVRSIRMEGPQILLDAKSCIEVGLFSESKQCTPDGSNGGFSKLFYRTDPPVDQSYLHPLQILRLGMKNSKNCELVNPFDVLVSSNEKMEAFAVDGLMPPSIVSSQFAALFAFCQREKRSVLKPLHLAQSLGVELIDFTNAESTKKSQELIAQATQSFTRPVLIQKYLPGIIKDGETRLWFLDGTLLASARKCPLKNDFRVNMDQGSRLISRPLMSREKKTAAKIARHLKRSKIRLAAVDLIDGLITDFNFTSPGLIVQMESLLNQDLASKIVKRLHSHRF